MKKLLLFSMWLAASAAAVGVAWAGVSVVDDQVVAPPSAARLAVPVSSDVGGETNVEQAPSPGLQGTSTSGDVADAAATADQVDDAVVGGQVSSSTTRPPVAGPSNSAAPPATSASPSIAPPTQPSVSSATTAIPMTVTPTAAAQTAPTASTLTFSLTGGTAAIYFSASGVQVLWATPNPGFDVNIENESPGIKVEFRADHHRSRLDAWWFNGPEHTTREEPRD